MKTRNAVMLTICAIAHCAFAQDADDISALPAQIKQIAKEESQSYERLLSRASPVAHKTCKGKNWADVASALESSGLKATTESDRWNYIAYLCPLFTNAVSIPGVRQTKLYLKFGVWTDKPESGPPRQTVHDTDVGLCVQVLASHEDILAKQWFGKGTVIQEALSGWQAKHTAMEFPILNEVDVFWGRVHDRIVGNGPQGFTLQFVFVEKADDTSTGRRLHCSASRSSETGDDLEPADLWQSQDFFPDPEVSELSANLARVIEDKALSYHQILQKTTHMVKRTTMNREWSKISKSLNAQGFTVLRDSPTQFGAIYRYLVKEAAYTIDNGQRLDLFIEFWTWRRTSKDKPTEQVVSQACAGFKASVNAKYADVVKRRPLAGTQRWISLCSTRKQEQLRSVVPF